MPTEILQLNQEGIDFKAQFTNSDGTDKNISGNTSVDMEFRKPDNTKVTENGITVTDANSGNVEYSETTNAKTNIKGAWEYRPIAIFVGSTVPGKWIQYIVSD